MAVSSKYATRRVRGKQTRGLTSKGLDFKVRDMTLEELLEQVGPLLDKYSRWVVPGLDPEDIKQELSVCVWRCHETWTPGEGSFLNYLAASCNKRMASLARDSVRHYQPVSALRCVGCGATRTPTARARRCRCGGGWEPVASEHQLVQMSVLEGDEGETRVGDPNWSRALDGVEFDLWVASLAPVDQRAVRKAVDGGTLGLRQRERLGGLGN